VFEVFGEFDPAEQEEEVKQRWGETEAYKESARRTQRYGKADWERFKRDSEEINATVVSLMDMGVAADDPREMHVELGKMYVDDPRFTANYEKIRPGMAQYVCQAIAANAACATGRPTPEPLSDDANRAT